MFSFDKANGKTTRSCIETFETISLRVGSLYLDLTFHRLQKADVDTIFRAIRSSVRRVTILFDGDFDQFAPWMDELAKCHALEDLELGQSNLLESSRQLHSSFERGSSSVKTLHLVHGDGALCNLILDWLESGTARLHTLELNPIALNPVVIRNVFGHSVCAEVAALHLFRTTPPVILDQLAHLQTLHMPIYLRGRSNEGDDRIPGALETISSLRHRPPGWPQLELHFHLLQGYPFTEERFPDVEAFDGCLVNLASADTVRVFHFETNSIRLAELDDFIRRWIPELSKITTVGDAGLKLYGMVDWGMIKVADS